MNILKNVFEKVVEGDTDKLVLDFGNRHLLIGFENIEEGEISYSFYNSVFYPHGYRTRVWGQYVGKELKWIWKCMNQDGIQDGIMLAFGKDIPSLCIVSVVTSLVVLSLIDGREFVL